MGAWSAANVLDVGCGFGDNAIYLAKNGPHRDRAGHLHPPALITAERRAKDAGIDVKFAVPTPPHKLEGYTDAFDTRDRTAACSTASMMTADVVTPPRCTPRHPAGRLLLLS